MALSHLADINLEERKENENEEITKHPSHVAMLVDESYLTGETCPVSIEEWLCVCVCICVCVCVRVLCCAYI